MAVGAEELHAVVGEAQGAAVAGPGVASDAPFPEAMAADEVAIGADVIDLEDVGVGE